MRLVLLVLVGLALAAFPLHAIDKVWVGLYLAENHPGEPSGSAKMDARLRQVFGYTHYKLLKGENVDLNDHPSYVLSRRDFFLRVRPMMHHGDEPRCIGYDIYRDGFIIANGIYPLAEDTPLFISGPDIRKGRLIFVIETR